MITSQRNAARSFTAGLILCAFTVFPAWAAEPDWNAINKMDRAAFVERFGGIFEKSPWVAEEAWEARPFSSIDDLHSKMVAVAKYGSIDQQLFLLRAHPDPR